MRDRPSWERYGLQLATVAAGRSEDPHVQVGAVVFRADNSVAGIGYNGAPSGITINWEDRDRRRPWVIHAEVNALRWVTPTEACGGWIATTHHPCAACLTVIASYGLKRLVYRDLPAAYYGDVAGVCEALGITALHAT